MCHGRRMGCVVVGGSLPLVCCFVLVEEDWWRRGLWPASFYCRSDKAVILARAAGR